MKCCKCEQDKPKDEFCADKRRATGTHAACKLCELLEACKAADGVREPRRAQALERRQQARAAYERQRLLEWERRHAWWHPSEDTQRCRQCEAVKPAADFALSWGGYRSGRCSACRRAIDSIKRSTAMSAHQIPPEMVAAKRAHMRVQQFLKEQHR